MKNQAKHWTEENIKDFLYRISYDFVVQLEERLEQLNMKKSDLAKKLNVSKGRVSQLLNNPGNMTLDLMIQYARAVGLKLSVLAYDDDDKDNERGPINADVFRICWERANKPSDLLALQEPQSEENLPRYKEFDKRPDIDVTDDIRRIMERAAKSPARHVKDHTNECRNDPNNNNLAIAA